MQKFIGIILILIISGLCNSSFAQPSIIFGKQFGTDKDDAGQEIVTYKSGDFVLAGTTLGDLYSTSLGKSDGFIIRYDSTGKEIWKKQFGTKDKDRVWKLKRDIRGNLYAAGNTYGTINGKKFGNRDMFVYKFDRNGNLLKSVILGTDSVDYLSDIYIDNNMNIYIAGNTKGKIGKKSYGNWDFFIMKLDSNFNKIYTYQFGTNKQDYCKDLKIDKNKDIYIVGGTEGKIGDTVAGKTDAFVAKYSQNGKLLMTKQFGTDKIDAAENIKGSLPPCIIIAAEDDKTTPLVESQLFNKNMLKFHNESHLIVYKGVCHLLSHNEKTLIPDKKVQAKAFKEIDLFLRKLKYIK